MKPRRYYCSRHVDTCRWSKRWTHTRQQLSLPAFPDTRPILVSREQRVTDAKHIEGYKAAIDVTYVASPPADSLLCFTSRHEESQNVITTLSIFKNEITGEWACQSSSAHVRLQHIVRIQSHREMQSTMVHVAYCPEFKFIPFLIFATKLKDMKKILSEWQ